MAGFLTKSANGSTVSAAVGAPVKIHLAGNPTTGYEWAHKGEANDAYAVDITYREQKTGMVGAGGVYHIVVTPKKVGTHPINLVYHRSFESDQPPAETFSVTLNVA